MMAIISPARVASSVVVGMDDENEGKIRFRGFEDDRMKIADLEKLCL